MNCAALLNNMWTVMKLYSKTATDSRIASSRFCGLLACPSNKLSVKMKLMTLNKYKVNDKVLICNY